MSAVPLCFVPAGMYALWRKADESLPVDGRAASSVCTDCLPSYQFRMKKLGRCQHPETRFRVSQDGAFFGTWLRLVSKKPVEKAARCEVVVDARPDFWRARHEAMLERLAR